MADMLIVATGEFCDPVPLFIRVETGDRSLHESRLSVMSGELRWPTTDGSGDGDADFNLEDHGGPARPVPGRRD